MNPFKSFYNWLSSPTWFGGDKRKSLQTNLTPSNDEEKNALIQENATYKAQLARAQIEFKKIREAEKEKNSEQEVIKNLRLQEKEINKDRYGETVSFGKLFLRLITDPNFRKKLEFTDKDDKTVLGTFGDFQISVKRGTMIFTDSNGNPLIESRTIQGLIYKPESLENQLKRNRIALPIDEKGNRAIDFDDVEIGEVIFDPDEDQTDGEGRPIFDKRGKVKRGVFSETIRVQRKARDIIQEKIKELYEAHEYTERLELTLNRLRNENLNLSLSLKTLKNQSSTMVADVSEAVGMSMQYTTRMGEMQSKITSLTELNAYHERKELILENTINKFLIRLDQLGASTQTEMIKEDIKTDLLVYKELLPQTIVQEIKPDKPFVSSKPGEVLNAPKIS